MGISGAEKWKSERQAMEKQIKLLKMRINVFICALRILKINFSR